MEKEKFIDNGTRVFQNSLMCFIRKTYDGELGNKLVGIRSHDIEKAKHQGLDIIVSIRIPGQYMTIPNKEIDQRFLYSSKNSYGDGEHQYKLHFYEYKPDKG